MNKYQYSHHPFDMNEYFSGERVAVGGMKCDWEEDEKKDKENIKKETERVITVLKKAVTKKNKKSHR